MRRGSRRICPPLVPLFAALALAIVAFAPFAAAAAVARSVAGPVEPRVDEAAYQRLKDAANAVVGGKVTAVANARSNDTLGQERCGSGSCTAPTCATSSCTPSTAATSCATGRGSEPHRMMRG